MPETYPNQHPPAQHYQPPAAVDDTDPDLPDYYASIDQLFQEIDDLAKIARRHFRNDATWPKFEIRLRAAARDLSHRYDDRSDSALRHIYFLLTGKAAPASFHHSHIERDHVQLSQAEKNAFQGIFAPHFPSLTPAEWEQAIMLLIQLFQLFTGGNPPAPTPPAGS